MKDSGYDHTLSFQNLDKDIYQKKQRKRKIIWYNPPFNKSLKTDLGRQFLNLLTKHFPQDNKLHKILNKNTVKLSYSCTRNMKRIIQAHNNKLLRRNDDDKRKKDCSCPKTKKDTCPLENKCLTSCIVYKATVVNSGHFYIGVTENDFKQRYAMHKSSFKNDNNKHSTSLSKHIWDIGENPNPNIKWEIIKKCQPRKPGSKECQLCLEEKLQILKNTRNPKCLNTRSELTTRCNFYHRSKHKLSSC